MQKFEFGPGLGWRTIATGIIGTISGILTTTFGVTIEVEQQAQWLSIASGLMLMLTGGGSILFRVLAGLPTLKAAADEIAKLKRELEEAKAARRSAPASAPVAG